MSLITIELKANWLNNQLQRPISNRLKILSICNFFSSFVNDEEQSKYISYYIQFKDELFLLINNNQFEYFTPDEIGNLGILCKKFFAVIPNWANDEKNIILQILNSAMEKIENILNGNGDEEKPGDPYSINQILVEESDLDNLSAGLIEKFYINANRPEAGEWKNQIKFDGIVKNNNDSINSELSRILSFVSKDYEKIIVEKNPHSYTLSFEKKEYSYSGISMGTGASVLIYNAALKINMHKFYYKFKHDVVMGSAIDNNGYLIPLEEEPLKIKLRTFFFSSYNKLVLPEDNIFDARKELEKLNEQYPNRKVELIPIKHYLQIFKNLDAVEVCKLKIREKVKANYNRYHTAANIIFSLLILIILVPLIINVVIPSLDNNPISTTVSDNRFVALNKYGKIIWKSDLLSSQEEIMNRLPNMKDHRILVLDIDDDGKNEILYLRFKNDDVLINRTLFCCSADGRLKWKFVVPKRGENYGDDGCPDKSSLKGINIFYNKSANKKEIILNSTVCELFPAFLYRLNDRGKLISEYYNPGAIDFVEIINFDSDGNIKIAIGGVNNDFQKKAFLAVLSPNNIVGSAPGKRLPPNTKISNVDKYLLFPKTVVCSFTSNKLCEASLLEYSKEQFSIFVNENNRFDPLKPFTLENTPLTVIYTFDRELNPINFSSSSEWDSKFTDLLTVEKLSPIKSWKEYKDSLLGEIEYWNGDKFVKYSAMNKYYRQTKAERESQ